MRAKLQRIIIVIALLAALASFFVYLFLAKFSKNPRVTHSR